MKKLLTFLLFCIVTFFPIKAYAVGNFVPNYTNSVSHFGIGAVLMSNNIVIYQAPDINSNVIQKIYWTPTGNYSSLNQRPPKDIFLAFWPTSNIALLSVEDEDDFWYKVCYDQKRGYFGYIKKDDKKHKAEFYSYPDLFYKYGKQYGLHLFRNISITQKRLYSSPSFESDLLEEFEIAKFITPWLIQGNWMLVKVTTYDNKTKTGWLNWRSVDGKIYTFINVQ